MNEQGRVDLFIAEIPNLRAFGRLLSDSTNSSDELVHATLLEAWDSFAALEASANPRAWLIGLLRNRFYSVGEGRSPQQSDAERRIAAFARGDPERRGSDEFRVAFGELSSEYREILALIDAVGLSAEETAAICGVAVVRIANRLADARARLAEILSFIDGDGARADWSIEASRAVEF